MKNFFLLAMCIWQLSSQAQSNAKPLNESGDCPDGYCAGFYLEIDQFNFHKPRTECTSGFGFCLRISVGATCITCASKTSFSYKTVSLTGFINKDIVELHLPKSSIEKRESTNEDWNNFEIVDKSFEIKYPNGSSVFLKGGSYPIIEEHDELLVRIPLD